MKSVRDIPRLENVPILVRAGLNEPIAGGVVADSFRLRRAAVTLRFLQEKHARTVVASHLDPPPGAGSVSSAETLRPIADALGKLLPRVSFLGESVGSAARAAVRALPAGDILVLENLRRHRGEVMNDPAFARELASLADAFIEDSFDTCHRLHASIVGVPTLLPSYAGLVVEEEVRALTRALRPAPPSLALIGGAKFSTKEPVLDALVRSYDTVFVGGALANDFLKAAGHDVGSSLVSPGADAAKLKALLKNPKLVIPIDSVVVRGSARRVASLADIGTDESIVDHGPATLAMLAELLARSRAILWNGPLGRYEDGFTEATDALAEAIASASASGRAYSVIGGGDTVAAIEKLGIVDRFSFVSTGGGAMLEFLAKGTLPGIQALG